MHDAAAENLLLIAQRTSPLINPTIITATVVMTSQGKHVPDSEPADAPHVFYRRARAEQPQLYPPTKPHQASLMEPVLAREFAFLCLFNNEMHHCTV
jgi:hypothetical protein